MNILGKQNLTTKEKVSELFKYLEHNSNDLQISIETSTCIFNLVTNQLKKTYENKPEKESILFYADIHSQLCSITTKEQLKDIIVLLYHDEENKKHTETNSRLVFTCMKIVIHTIWQQCAKSAGIILLNTDVDIREKLLNSFLNVVEECSNERNIKFPNL